MVWDFGDLPALSKPRSAKERILASASAFIASIVQITQS